MDSILHQLTLDTPPLINGRPTYFFQSSKGLRQGCPLSLLLFIMMANTLSRKLESERVIGNLPGIQMVGGIKRVNHSHFADNTLLISGASLIVASRFNKILDSFLDTSGGALNRRKCHIYGWNSNLQVMHSISRLFKFP